MQRKNPKRYFVLRVNEKGLFDLLEDKLTLKQAKAKYPNAKPLFK